MKRIPTSRPLSLTRTPFLQPFPSRTNDPFAPHEPNTERLPPSKVRLDIRQHSRRQAEPGAQRGSHALGLAQCRLHPRRRGTHAGVTEIHGIARERSYTPPEWRKRSIVAY